MLNVLIGRKTNSATASLGIGLGCPQSPKTGALGKENMEEKIVIIVGNMEQFRYWIRNNIIPITCKYDMKNLRGIRIREVFYEGTYEDWIDNRILDEIKLRETK